jgi:hypothetical protein
MKSYKEIRDIIYNNPRADKQSIDDNDDKEEKKIKDKMLYDDVIKRMKDAYQKRKRQKKIDKLKSNDNHWKGLS